MKDRYDVSFTADFLKLCDTREKLATALTLSVMFLQKHGITRDVARKTVDLAFTMLEAGNRPAS